MSTTFGIAGASLSFRSDAPRGHEWTVVAHCISISAEIHTLYHNRPLLPVLGIPAACWPSRFAWDLFPKLIPFPIARQPRVLAIQREDGQSDEREYNHEQCVELCQAQGRGRSISSLTRQRVEESNASPAANETAASGSFDSGVSELDEYSSTDGGLNGVDKRNKYADDGIELADLFGRKRRQQQRSLCNAGKSVHYDEEDEHEHNSLPRGRKRSRL